MCDGWEECRYSNVFDQWKYASAMASVLWSTPGALRNNQRLKEHVVIQEQPGCPSVGSDAHAVGTYALGYAKCIDRYKGVGWIALVLH